MSKLYSVVCNSCQIKTGSGMLAFFFFLKSHYTQQVLNCKLMQKKKSRALNGISLLVQRAFSGTTCKSFDLKNLHNIPNESGNF